MSEYEWESLKIGAGPPPLRVEEGWLLLHHGVSGELVPGWAQQPAVHYAAGAMLLDAHDPARVLSRSSEPLLSPESEEERSGTVDNVVFPTAIEEVEAGASCSTGWPAAASASPSCNASDQRRTAPARQP